MHVYYYYYYFLFWKDDDEVNTETPFGLGALFFLIFCKVSVSSISVCFLFFKAFDSAFDVIPYMLLLFVFFFIGFLSMYMDH